MNILAVGSKITIRKICEDIIGEVENINLVDFNNKNYLNWKLSMSNKVKYNTGDIEKIDTLIKAGLEDSDIVIDGDIMSQQGIRFNIFQLNQTFNIYVN